MESSLSSDHYLPELMDAELTISIHENACEEMTFDLTGDGTR